MRCVSVRLGSLAAILLTTGASCTTVSPSTDIASRPGAGSHFQVIAEPTETRTDHKLASKPKSPSKNALAAAFEAHDNAATVESAIFEQPETPPTPTPSEPTAPTSPQANPDETRSDLAIDESSLAAADGLALEEAIHMAIGANPTVGEAMASVQRLKNEWAQTGFYPNPTAGYVATEVGDSGKAGQQGIYFGQIFPTADKLDWNRAVASGGVAYAQAQAEAQRLRVVTDTAIRFYEALGAQRLVEIAERIQNNAQKGFDATEALVQAGQSAKADLLQADAVLQRANVGVQQAKARAEGSWRRLAAVMGRPNMARTKLVGDLDREPREPAFETLWQRLSERSPELQAASARVARQRAKIGREEAQAIPNVNTQNFLQYDTATDTTIFGLQWQVAVPIIHQNEGTISASRAAYVRACRDYERTKLNLRDRLAQAVRDVEVAQAQAVTYRKEVIPAATESLSLVRKGYQQGQFDVLRLIASQRIYAEAAAEYVQALIELRSAESRIDGLLLTGGLDAPVKPQPLGGAAGLAGVPRAE